VTALGQHGITDAHYEAARKEFDEADLVKLTM
jgi:hypothetical protein